MNAMIAPIGKRLQPILSTFLLLLLLPALSSGNTETLQEANDFQTISTEMRDKGLPLLLMFRADYCGYCRQLEDEYLVPMQKSGKYDARILIQRFTLDKTGPVTDFNGEKLDTAIFAEKYQASLTPTLVFLDTEGKEVAERLLGYNSPDFYGAYLENAIDTAYQTVKAKK